MSPVFKAGLLPLTDKEAVILHCYYSALIWTTVQKAGRAHADSAKWPFICIIPSSDRGKTVWTVTWSLCLLTLHRWLPEGTTVRGRFWRVERWATPVWLGKHLWGLICSTPPQKRGCNSISIWPTVLPLAGSAAQAPFEKAPLRKCPSECLDERKAFRLCNSQSACPFFTDPVSFSYPSRRPHKADSALIVQEKRQWKTISGQFAVEQK